MLRQAFLAPDRILSYENLFPTRSRFLDSQNPATKAHCIRTIALFPFIGQCVWAFRLLFSLIRQGFVSCGYNNINRQAISAPRSVFSHETFSPIHIQLLYGPRNLPRFLWSTHKSYSTDAVSDGQ